MIHEKAEMMMTSQKNKYTKFDHPLLAANVIRELKGNELSDEEIEMIATTIESHMGAWNTDKRSSTVLPLPKNKYQTIFTLSRLPCKS